MEHKEITALYPSLTIITASNSANKAKEIMALAISDVITAMDATSKVIVRLEPHVDNS